MFILESRIFEIEFKNRITLENKNIFRTFKQPVGFINYQNFCASVKQKSSQLYTKSLQIKNPKDVINKIINTTHKYIALKWRLKYYTIYNKKKPIQECFNKFIKQ